MKATTESNPAMDSYLQTLSQVAGATGDGKSYRQGEEKLNVKLKAGEVYAIRATDNPDYYFTITIQPNPYSGGFRKVISQFPTYGDPPPQMEIVTQEEVFKQFRELNGDGAMSNFNAFPSFPTNGGAR